MTPELSSAHVLIVDDNVKNLDALAAILDDPTLEIVRATSGEEALRCMLREDDFALVILDVRMPGGIDGFECAKLMRSSPRFANTPIIFLTGVATDMEFIFKGYASGGVDYVIKPFEPAVVKAKVAVFVELFRARKSLTMQIEALEALAVKLNHEILERTTELKTLQDGRYRGLHPRPFETPLN